VAEIIERLQPEYGPARTPREYDPVSELVHTVLSQHTSDANSTRPYASLREAFPTWEAMAGAPEEAVARSIRMGGLAQLKARRIQAVLRELQARTGGYDLSFLAQMPMAEAKAWLRSLPGVGPKTAGCVLVFSLGMPAMVVDTHVYRVAKRLGLYGPSVNADRSHDVLEAMVPPQDVLRFHMHLIRHGRRVCKAQRPRCDACVLEPRCPSSALRARAPAQKERARRTASRGPRPAGGKERP